MSGYPYNPQGYGNGPPPSQPYSSAPYGAASGPATSQPYSSAPYGAAPGQAPSQPYSSAPYGAAPGPAQSQPYSSAPYGAAPPSPGGQHQYASTASPYGAPSAPYAPSSVPGDKPHKENKPYAYGAHPPPSAAASASGYPPQGHQHYGGSPFASLVPSAFPPGTDPSIVACFQIADQDGSGLIDDKELQGALSSYNQSFSLRTVHLLMYNFTNSNSRKIGPKEFTGLYYSLQNWRSIFDRFDRDRSGKIDTGELRDALLSLGFGVSPAVLELLVSKFDKTGGRNRAIEYDNFIECCLTVKGLTEKFKEKDTKYSGSATFTYESFMLTVLPFLIA